MKIKNKKIGVEKSIASEIAKNKKKQGRHSPSKILLNRTDKWHKTRIAVYLKEKNIKKRINGTKTGIHV